MLDCKNLRCDLLSSRVDGQFKPFNHPRLMVESHEAGLVQQVLRDRKFSSTSFNFRFLWVVFYMILNMFLVGPLQHQPLKNIDSSYLVICTA